MGVIMRGTKKFSKNKITAFTLAEMMVVMLIVSIVLAAMAPVMTTKNKVDNSSPWRYSPANSSDAYFGAGEAMRAFIGQVNGEDADLGKLIINNNATGNSHILFKSNNDVLGDLYFNGTSLILGSRPSNSTNATYGANNISIGPNNWSSTGVEGDSNITIGDNAMNSLTTGRSNIGIGTTLNAVTTGSNNVAVGDNSLLGSNGDYNVAVGTRAYQQGTGGSNVIVGGDAMSKYSGNNNVVMGTQAMYYGSGNNNVAIGTNANYNGTNSETTYEGTTAVGHNAQARSLNSTAIGRESIAGTAVSGDSFANAVAVGHKANATGLSSVAIGQEASSSGEQAISINGTASGGDAVAINGTAAGFASIAMGISSSSSGNSSVAIGNRTSSSNLSAIAIGLDAQAAGLESVAIGSNTNANGSRNTAIGTNACRFVNGSNKTCIGANSGPSAGHVYSRATDNYERIFIGSRSKFNGGAAVLEVHNLDTRRSGGAYDRWYSNQGCDLGSCSRLNDTTVFINGNLVVRGTTFITSKHRGGDSFVIKALEHTGGQMEPAPHGDGWGDTAEGWIPSLHSSDRRLKYVGKESASGLDKIRQLKVFNYTFKKDTAKTPHVGVIAQDLQKVFPNAVKKGTDGFLTIRMEDMFYAVINTIKELDSRVTTLEKENKELKVRLDKLEAKLK